MGVKVFKTIDEQIEILKNKGLTINDIDKAKYILLRENYFFISGYRHEFLKSEVNRKFIEGTTFDHLYAMFYFDRQLRNIIFKNILIFENNLKSVLSYVISKNRGYKENKYLNIESFNRNPKKSRQLNDLLRKMARQIRINSPQHSATSHYLINYDYIPLWIAVKVLSFGIVSELYTMLKYEDQIEIANLLSNQVSVKNIISYLPIVANYRNLCAHEDLCYNHRTQKFIEDTEYHMLLNIPKMNGEYIYGKNDLFSLAIILKKLLAPDEFKMFLDEVSYEISRLQGKISSLSAQRIMDKMGFPPDYRDLVRL